MIPFLLFLPNWACFNKQTSHEYLQVSPFQDWLDLLASSLRAKCQPSLYAILTANKFNLGNSRNSEVSQSLLDMCAFSSGALSYIQNALIGTANETAQYNSLQYATLVHHFGLQDIKIRALDNIDDAVFCTLLLYFSTFTFDNAQPRQYLIIPNQITAKHLHTSFLQRCKLAESMQNAIHFLALSGNIISTLKVYPALYTLTPYLGEWICHDQSSPLQLLPHCYSQEPRTRPSIQIWGHSSNFLFCSFYLPDDFE